jgi:hypothetical protein
MLPGRARVTFWSCSLRAGLRWMFAIPDMVDASWVGVKLFPKSSMGAYPPVMLAFVKAAI